MIAFTATLKAKVGSEKKVEDILKGMIPPVQNEKGTVKYILHRSKAEPSLWMAAGARCCSEPATTLASSTGSIQAKVAR